MDTKARVLVSAAGDVTAVIMDGVRQATFEIMQDNATVASTCKYCGVAIEASEDYWTRGADYCDWYSEDDCYCMGTPRAHEPEEIIVTTNPPTITTVGEEAPPADLDDSDRH